MVLFKRRRPEPVLDAAPDQPASLGESTGATTADQGGGADGDEPTASGPHDESERPSLAGLIDFGAIRLPARAGFKVTAGVAKATGRPVSLTVAKGGSQIELQAFAAPKTTSVWEEGLDRLAESVGQQGGKATRANGRFGAELIAEIPTATAQGRTGKQVVRFIGADGPRWLLRGAIGGKAARDRDAAVEIEDFFAGVVVARGAEARPPREALPLKLPGGPKSEDEAASESDAASLLRRGPEITEVR
ncbi:MAG: DUF3710 domain-containing protein [Bifidobacteriaceae bacterium]|jgi:hypothetical protein|nr:DUF3710 domain-containing protein [Bifidobacteriaceae bacterium]